MQDDKVNTEHALALEHVAALARQLVAQSHREVVHVRELHHRMANDLQLVSSLVSLRLRNTSNKEFAGLGREVLAQLRAISRLHRRLMLSADVQFGAYLIELAAEMTAIVAQPEIEIKATTEAVVLPSRVAAPLALVTVELITNAVKHGLAPQGGGAIDVTFKRPDEHHCVLKVFDTGPGLNGAPREGHGISVIGNLVASIGGTIQFHARPSMEVKIILPLGD